MSEEHTRELPEGRSFEERVFARFDAMDVRFSALEARFDATDARLDAIETRLDKVEVRLDRIEDRVQALEAKALDTKPIWERALAEIFEVKAETVEVKAEIVEVKAGTFEVKAGVEDLNRKFDVLTMDVMQVRADQRRVNKRMDELEVRVQ